MTNDESNLSTGLLSRILQITLSGQDTVVILESLCKECVQALGVDRAAILLLEKQHSRLKTLASAGQDQAAVEPGETFVLENHPAAAYVVQYAVPLAIADLARDSRFVTPSLPGRTLPSGLLMAPLVIQSQVVGLLELSTLHPRVFTAGQVELVQTVSAAASRVLETARLRDELRRQGTQREHHLRQLQSAAEEIDRKNRALAEAQQQRQQVSQMVSEFLAFLSHEIRTPITSIVGMNELLLSTALDREQRDYAQIIRDSAQIMLGMVNDVLDFSKIEAGKLELESILFEPLQVVEGAADMFSARARQKSISLMTFVSPRIPYVLEGDPVRLRQVLMNLIGNALKFTESGEIMVRAELLEDSPESLLLRFEVQDTGIGIPLETLDRLFVPFNQAQSSTARRYGGTGLGLAISKRLVELMGGQIGVESEAGLGSTFWFTARVKSCAPGEGQGAAPMRVSLESMHVLVVDDNPHHRQIVLHYLDSWGMRGEEAESAEQALQRLERAAADADPFEIAILDLAMPGTGGFELAEQVESSQNISVAHLILMTAFDQAGQGEEAAQRGFSAYLTKPVKQSLLYDSIANAVLGKPAYLTTGRVAPLEAQWDRPGEDAGGDHHKGTVLLAEDNLANQRLGVIQLQKLGYRVDAVESGVQAVEAVLKNPGRYHMVFMDCLMPEMDGFAAARAVRKAESTLGTHIPIIAMTAHALHGDRENCLAAGMDDYLSKPVSLENLRLVIERWNEKEDINLIQAAAKGKSKQRVLNPQILAEIRELQPEGEPDFLTELIDLYLVDSRSFLDRIHALIAEGRFEEILRPVHSLKGTSANLGAAVLPALCSEMEELIRKADDQAVRNFLPVLEEEYKRVRVALGDERVQPV